MNLVTTLDIRYTGLPDGSVWLTAGPAYDYWKQFLSVFDGVVLVARVQRAVELEPGMRRVDGPGVSIVPLPFYLGAMEYLRRRTQLITTALSAVSYRDCYVLTASSAAGPIQKQLINAGYPYAMNVIGDPYLAFAPRGFRHPLRPLLRVWSTARLKQMCANASAAIYVTKRALQSRYPCSGHTVGISDVDLDDASFAKGPRQARRTRGAISLVMVGSLAQMYKAPDVVISAVAACVKEGIDIKLAIIGDGKYRCYLERHAQSCGLGDRVEFRGMLPSGAAVREELDRADVFVLPSFAEGMPRAMLEAMARALPCIGSSVGGMPELLLDEEMVSPGDVLGLAKAIRNVVSDPGRMAAMSARNWRVAQRYHASLLLEQRLEFYRTMRLLTEAHLEKRGLVHRKNARQPAGHCLD